MSGWSPYSIDDKVERDEWFKNHRKAVSEGMKRHWIERRINKKMDEIMTKKMMESRNNA
jgi:hypothetical protein